MDPSEPLSKRFPFTSLKFEAVVVVEELIKLGKFFLGHLVLSSCKTHPGYNKIRHRDQNKVNKQSIKTSVS